MSSDAETIDATAEGGAEEGVARGEPFALRWQRLCVERRLFKRREALRVGRFEVRELIGYGGMGAVFEGYDPSLDRPIAIKVLHPRYVDRPGAGARLAREAKAMAKVSHAHVVTIHEVGVEHGQPYIAMELVSGGTLEDWLAEHERGEPGRVEALLRLLVQCIDGLLAAHDAGLVHRDFKPANVLIGPDGGAKVGDFGIVRLVEVTAPEASDARDGDRADDAFAGLDPHHTLTADGATPGTPRYMAPEQFRGVADPRTDQFALCRVFREALQGETISASIAAALDRGASDDPADRYPDLRALRADVQPEPVPRRSTPVALWVGAAGLVVAGVGAAMMRPSADAEATTSTAGDACDDGSAAMNELWGETERAQMKARFERSGNEAWARAWDGARTRIEAYVADWKAARLDACEATRIRRVQGERTMQMRMGCLDQRRDALASLTDAFASADVEIVEHAIDGADALPPISSCADRAELEYGDEGRGLDDPELRAAYEAVGRADTLRTLGRLGSAEAGYREVEPQLRDLGASSLLARALKELSFLVCERGDYEAAAQLAREALAEAERAGRDPEVHDAWLQMANVARLTGDFDDAKLYLERAQSIATRHSSSKQLRYATELAWGHYHGDTGDSEASLAALERARDLATEIDLGPRAVMGVERLILTVLTPLGRVDEAVELGQRLLAQSAELYGANHSFTLSIANAHALSALDRGKFEEAAELTRPALTRSFDESRADMLITSRGAHATALSQLGEFEQARAVYEDTLAKAVPILGEQHQGVITTRLTLAGLHQEMGDPQTARLEYRKLIDIVGNDRDGTANEKLHPLNRFVFWGGLAQAAASTGRPAEALEALGHATDACTNAAAPESYYRFMLHVIAGDVYTSTDERAKARAEFERALELGRAVKVGPEQLAEVEASLEALGR